MNSKKNIMRKKSWGKCEVFLQGNRGPAAEDGDILKAPTINKAMQVLQKMEALACDVWGVPQQATGLQTFDLRFYCKEPLF